MKAKILLLSILLLFFYSCKKDDVANDYRTKYYGEFNYTTLHNWIFMEDTGGWHNEPFDTTYYSSNITPIDSNRIIIKFKPDDIQEDVYGENILTIHYPILNIDGHLEYPEFPGGGHQGIRDYNFIGYDSLYLCFFYGGMIGGYEQYIVIGQRNRNSKD